MPMVAKREKRRGRRRERKSEEEAGVDVGCRARQRRWWPIELKKRKKSQEKEGVEVVYVKCLFVKKRSEWYSEREKNK